MTSDLIRSAPLKFEFEVAAKPFPWTTAWLSALLVLLVALLSWGAIEHRQTVRASRTLVELNHQLKLARLNLATEAEAERRRIARDLHDQTLADLRRLALLSDKWAKTGTSNGANNADSDDTADDAYAASERAALDHEVFRNEIESISSEVRRICEDLSPSVLDNVGLGAALQWALSIGVAQLPPERRFTFEFACDENFDDRLQMPVHMRMQIYRIVQEAINNICCHSSATHVNLNANVSLDGTLLITLADNGGGFDPQTTASKRGRGIANILARANLVDAEVRWRQLPEGGTLFTLHRQHTTS